MYYYAFTIRYLKSDKTPEEVCDFYLNHLKNFKEKYTHIDVQYHYEVVKKDNGHDNIHVHGMLETSRKLHVRMLHPGPNCHCWLEFVKSKLAWIAYMSKSNLMTKQDVLDEYDMIEPIVVGQEISDEDIINPGELYKKCGRIV